MIVGNAIAVTVAATKAIVRNGTIVVVDTFVGVIVSIGYCGGRGSRTDSIRIRLNEHTIACYFNCCHHFLLYCFAFKQKNYGRRSDLIFCENGVATVRAHVVAVRAR